MANEYFMNNTLIILTFDECEIYPKQNRTDILFLLMQPLTSN